MEALLIGVLTFLVTLFGGLLLYFIYSAIKDAIVGLFKHDEF